MGLGPMMCGDLTSGRRKGERTTKEELDAEM